MKFALEISEEVHRSAPGISRRKSGTQDLDIAAFFWASNLYSALRCHRQAEQTSASLRRKKKEGAEREKLDAAVGIRLRHSHCAFKDPFDLRQRDKETAGFSHQLLDGRSHPDPRREAPKRK